MPFTRTMASALPPAIPIALASLGVLALAACADQTGMRKPPVELSDEQVCLQHFEHDPVERDRCHKSGEDRRGPPDDADAHQLPIKTDNPNH